MLNGLLELFGLDYIEMQIHISKKKIYYQIGNEYFT
jgi:hypothetical protein